MRKTFHPEENGALDQIEKIASPLRDGKSLDTLMEAIGNSHYVLLGEASHGTHEYYTWRTAITKRLIKEKGFSFIAVEGDWPDCYRVNRYIKGYPDSGTAASDVLHSFNRWPTWMWGNWETVALAEWLKEYNTTAEKKIGFYGLDVYSLWESMEAIKEYLEKNDPSAVEIVKKTMDCFEPYQVREGFSYASHAYGGFAGSCKAAVNRLLHSVRESTERFHGDNEAALSAEQNALITVNAERYYEVMLNGGDASWNIRDRHMNETLNRLMKFHEPNAKVIVWEHNTHIGDARATDMTSSGLVNVGQLVKQEHDEKGVFRVGFGSYEGSVMASHQWGGEMQEMDLPKARFGSWEHLLHRSGAKDKLLLTKDLKDHLREKIGHRAVGVVYDPDFEAGNYVMSNIPERYEAFIFLDRTWALHPLHLRTEKSQMPETYPWGF
ncbi:MAG: erythromycin esterase family protein [Bacteroidia bacterium]